MIPSGLYVFYCGPKKPILLTDILALSFGHDAMSMLKIDSFKTGSILLSGLFFYDVWWVFGTKVVCDICHSLDQSWQMTELLDGQCGNQPRPPNENSLAKVDHVLYGERNHDARLGRHRCSWDFHLFGSALRPFSVYQDQAGRNIYEALLHRFTGCLRGRARHHDDGHARFSRGTARAIIPQVRRNSLLYMRAERMLMKWKQSCLYPLLCYYRLAPRGAHRSLAMERWS